jgi:hypothetical protein
MAVGQDSQPFVVFTPDLRRFLFAELWSTAVVIGASAVLVYLLRDLSRTWLLTVSVVSLLAVLYQATFSRRSRRVQIGDTWIRGPTNAASHSTTLQFGTVDWSRSGIERGRLRLKSISGQQIMTKTAWYALEDIEEIKRLLRNRCDSADLPASFY